MRSPAGLGALWLCAALCASPPAGAPQPRAAPACPAPCRCQEDGIMLSADCSELGLSAVPRDLDPLTAYLLTLSLEEPGEGEARCHLCNPGVPPSVPMQDIPSPCSLELGGLHLGPVEVVLSELVACLCGTGEALPRLRLCFREWERGGDGVGSPGNVGDLAVGSGRPEGAGGEPCPCPGPQTPAPSPLCHLLSRGAPGALGLSSGCGEKRGAERVR